MVWQRCNGFQKSYFWRIHYLDRFIWCSSPAHHCLKVECAKKPVIFYYVGISRITKSRKMLGLFIYLVCDVDISISMSRFLWTRFLRIRQNTGHFSFLTIPSALARYGTSFHHVWQFLVQKGTISLLFISDLCKFEFSFFHSLTGDTSIGGLIWIGYLRNCRWYRQTFSNKGLNGFEGDTIWRD